MKRKRFSILMIFLLIAVLARVNGQETDRDEWEETLLNYIKAASSFNKLQLPDREAGIYDTIAEKYFGMKVYRKAASYYEQAFSLYTSGKDIQMARSAENAAKSWFFVPDDTLSLKWYEAAQHYYGIQNDSKGRTRCNSNIAGLFMRMGDYTSAGNIYEKLLTEFNEAGDSYNEALVYNNIGYLKFRMKKAAEAIEDFRNAVATSSKGGKNPGFLTEVFSNIAVCYQALGQQRQMLENFNTALDYARKAGREDESARIARILAAVYLNKKDFYHAELYCRDCIESAVAASTPAILLDCYKTYSEVLQQGNDFVKALEYYEKYLYVRDSLSLEDRLNEQGELSRQSAYEDLEQRLKLAVADQEFRDLEMKNLRTEAAGRENEMKLLVKQQQLDSSEKERLSQSLLLERERYVLGMRDQEVRSLQVQQRADSLELKQKEEEAISLDRQNKLLESEKRQQELAILKEKQIKKLAFGIGILLVIVAVTILSGLISTRRKNQKLAESKRHIEEINTDLESKNTEIIRQKDIIEQKNQAITDSIHYASRIQSAVLPPIGFISEWGFENFILYRPKDIVSGDFYWGLKKDNKFVTAAVDCTGHGVPGAIMSMLGHAFLDEILITKPLTDAASILNLLREEVINALKQKGMVGEARDGMDIALCIIDRDAGKLDFAGANNPLYLVRDNKLIKVPADNMPIGIHVTAISPFTNRRLDIFNGDKIYIFSDGFADQFGGTKGKKFMYKPFQNLILGCHSSPMPEQKELLEKTFIDWMGQRDQVDDVLVMGISI